MNVRNSGLLAVTAVLAATLIGGGTAGAQVRPNTFNGTGTGSGSTLAGAEQAARADLLSNYGGCGPWYLISDSQAPDGTWTATVGATCKSIR